MASHPLFKIQEVPSKGKGAVALEDIKAGTLIISESIFCEIPLVRPEASKEQRDSAFQAQLEVLDLHQQQDFFSLENRYPEYNPIEGIMRTNGIALGPKSPHAAIFLLCSRFNHSCSTNAVYYWNANMSRETIHAVKEIQEGEEITVSYLSTEDWIMSREERRRMISMQHRFSCYCVACIASPEAVAASDRRRRRIMEMQESISEGNLLVHNPRRGLKFCRDVLMLLQLEGEFGAMACVVYFDAFQFCVANCDFARASCFAALYMRKKIFFAGGEVDDYEGVRAFIENPERHDLAGYCSFAWKTVLRDRRSLDSEGFEQWLWQRVLEG
ncbi:uncharacterized protein N7511_006435 [Penicillium nucicola]|uniref:uncharacterized protein n=1 Tax=Penicillium nucicola TaxID=1850975 RepID=UPI0025454425|nr:uncharacterized protein N7511_006435 [Penicillium nucicola]KAJ5757741.1 hypothetical protein N7511_006435 [Penicillium nucicola]